MILETLALLSATATQCPPATESGIRQLFQRWTEAYDAKDFPETMAIFAPEVRFQFQGVPDQGLKELEGQYRRAFDAPAQTSWTPKWEQVLVSGNLATAFATWTGARKKTDGTWEVRAENRSVDVLQRGSDCQWRIVRSLTYPAKAQPAPAAK